MQKVFNLAANASDHLVRMRRFDAAASILENYLSANPAHPEILRRLGKIRLQQGRPEAAARAFEQALEALRGVRPAAAAAAVLSETARMRALVTEQV